MLFPRLLRPYASMAFGFAAIAAASFIAAAPAHAQNTYGTDQRYCDQSTLSKILSPTTGNLLGSAAGAAAGGLLGSQVGKSSGNTIATIVGVLGGAVGGGYIGRAMDPSDRGCVGQSLEHAQPQQSVAWQNPGTGSSYWVTPTRDLRGRNGEVCRKYVTDAVVNHRRQKTTNVACQQSDGNWAPVSSNYVQAAYTPSRPPADESAGPVSGDLIFKVQQALHDKGFYVTSNIDGKWGPGTSSALTNFQRSKGLPPTGQINTASLSALGVR